MKRVKHASGAARRGPSTSGRKSKKANSKKNLGRRTSAKPPSKSDEVAYAKYWDQYYTQHLIAAALYQILLKYIDPKDYLFVEPSAGTGAFLPSLPQPFLAYDVHPKHPGIMNANFLTVTLPGNKRIIVIGNPPFGKCASAAVAFFNHAASHPNVEIIAMIFPRTFRKFSLVNRLNQEFHLLHEHDLPEYAFLFNSKPFNIPAVFQIWVRKPVLRPVCPKEVVHPDFEFTDAKNADFAIQRVGARAGRIHHNFKLSASSHYFIKGNVEGIMRQLDFARFVGDVAGNPSLSKAEIVHLYSEFIKCRKAA